MRRICLSFCFCTLINMVMTAQNDADALAKQLQNPISSLISVPFQGNMDFGIGSDNGTRFTLNIQPVIPVSISENWNLVTRVVLPFVSQSDVFYKIGRAHV